jgi:hypothetical protein
MPHTLDRTSAHAIDAQRAFASWPGGRLGDAEAVAPRATEPPTTDAPGASAAAVLANVLTDRGDVVMTGAVADRLERSTPPVAPLVDVMLRAARGWLELALGRFERVLEVLGPAPTPRPGWKPNVAEYVIGMRRTVTVA